VIDNLATLHSLQKGVVFHEICLIQPELAWKRVLHLKEWLALSNVFEVADSGINEITPFPAASLPSKSR
jgi:hypothetical protein